MRRLIVLRPEPGASATVERARALGLEATSMPLFKVESVAWTPPEAGGFDALLLTSANAVRHAGDQLHAVRGLKAYAVGEATAEVAREAGFDIAATGSSGVERLLSSLEADMKLLHLCGEDRIEFEARQQIEPVVVYRSCPIPRPEGFDRALAGATAAVHSPRSGRRLAELASEAGVDRNTIRIAAISATAAAAAGDGWERLQAADRPDDEALLALAARLCDKPDPQ